MLYTEKSMYLHIDKDIQLCMFLFYFIDPATFVYVLDNENSLR